MIFINNTIHFNFIIIINFNLNWLISVIILKKINLETLPFFKNLPKIIRIYFGFKITRQLPSEKVLAPNPF